MPHAQWWIKQHQTQAFTAGKVRSILKSQISQIGSRRFYLQISQSVFFLFDFLWFWPCSIFMSLLGFFSMCYCLASPVDQYWYWWGFFNESPVRDTIDFHWEFCKKQVCTVNMHLHRIGQKNPLSDYKGRWSFPSPQPQWRHIWTGYLINLYHASFISFLTAVVTIYYDEIYISVSAAR